MVLDSYVSQNYSTWIYDRRKSKMMTMIVEFGAKKFRTIKDPSGKKGSEPCSFEIHPIYRSQGYAHPVRYRNATAVQVMDWCQEHAAGSYLHHQAGRAVLFKDENTAMMFKLTFNE